MFTKFFKFLIIVLIFNINIDFVIAQIYKNYLSLQQKQNFLTQTDRNLNGIILTEEEKPTNIKYLKTITTDNPQFFTLFGNTQNNQIACPEQKACVIYGSEGDDEIYQKDKYADVIIKDFLKRNEKDKLIIKKGFDENYQIIYGKLPNTKLGTQIVLTYGWLFKVKRKIFLEGVSEEEVVIWLKRAKGEIYSDDISKNPIQLE